MWRKVRQKEADFRCDARYPINYHVTGEHKHLGTIILKISNLSSTGTLVDGKAGIERG